jgi:methionine-rich copper-binding protein CopC
MMTHIRIRRAAAVLFGACLALVLLPGLVAAHAELVTPTPSDKATLTQPVGEVSGIYSEAMIPTGSSLIVKDGFGATVAQGSVDPAANTRMVAKPASPLGTGVYSVEWTSVATDGHVERGTWTFGVAVVAPPSPTPVATAAPSTAATPAPTAPPTAPPTTPPTAVAVTPVPSAAGDATGSGNSDVILPIIVALIMLAAGAAYLLSRRNRPLDRT